MILAYWITFREGPGGCIESTAPAAAINLAESLTGRTVIGCEILPQPADPRLVEHCHAVHGVMPSICTTPMRCRGRVTCPRRPVTCTGDKL